MAQEVGFKLSGLGFAGAAWFRALAGVSIIGVLVWPDITLALDPARKPHQHLHDVWQVDEGLPQNSVTSIVQSRQGYLWLGTQEGLVRYDGTTFAVFDKHNTPAIQDSHILDIIESSGGELWVATQRGLVRYSNGAFSRLSTSEGLPHEHVYRVLEVPGDSLLVGTKNGLGELTRTGGRTWTTENGLLGSDVRALAVDASGNWLVGTEGGLQVYHDGRFETLLTGSDQVAQGVRSLWVDGDGTIWAGTRGAGLYEIRDGLVRQYRRRDGLVDEHVNVLFRDDGGTLWIGTAVGGLVSFRDGVFTAITSDHGLSSHRIESIYEDREGSLWVGTATGGLNRFWDGQFSSLTMRDGLPDDLVWAVYEDAASAMWVGTDRGITRYAKGHFETFDEDDGLVANVISAFYQREVGTPLWIGTEGGLSRFHNGRFKSWTRASGLSHPDVRSVVESADGSVWIGTHGGGLNLLKDDVVTVYGVEAGLVNNDVTTLFIDHAGALWIGTDEGLSRFRDGRFENFRRAEGLVDTKIFAVHQDSEHVMWIGTDDGLYRYRDGTFSRISVGQGLFDDKVYTILEDGDGNFWMSCNKGIFKASKLKLHAVADGRVSRIKTVGYGVEDGMKSVECNYAGRNSGWKSRSGLLWFPTIAGVAIVNPRVEANLIAPPIIIEKVVADEYNINFRGGWVSPPGVKSLEFHYAAPSFIVPEKTALLYRLRGHGSNWVSAGRRRVAHYANLAPGEYVFEVKAVDKFGWESTDVALFHFEITPTFFQTDFFYLAAVLSLFCLVLLFYRHRVKTFEVQEARLARLIRERTAQLEDANRKLIEQSFRDPLTGLRNRRFLLESVEKDLAYVDRTHFAETRDGGQSDSGIVFVMIDIDHFKVINDTYGHVSGDRVLLQVADILRDVCRLSDTVIRWGGEEFLMVARNTAAESAHILASRILAAFDDHRFDLGGHRDLSVTCSIGFACYPFLAGQSKLLGWEDVVSVADQALYCAKNSGRDRWVGIFSTERTPTESLMSTLRDDVPGMVAREELWIVSSVEDTSELVWN